MHHQWPMSAMMLQALLQLQQEQEQRQQEQEQEQEQGVEGIVERCIDRPTAGYDGTTTRSCSKWLDALECASLVLGTVVLEVSPSLFDESKRARE